jgi:hypothetical protein
MQESRHFLKMVKTRSMTADEMCARAHRWHEAKKAEMDEWDGSIEDRIWMITRYLQYFLENSDGQRYASDSRYGGVRTMLVKNATRLRSHEYASHELQLACQRILQKYGG